MTEENQRLEVLWTVAQAARYLSVNKFTIYRWIKEEKIRKIKFSNRVRIPRSEIEKLAGIVRDKIANQPTN